MGNRTRNGSLGCTILVLAAVMVAPVPAQTPTELTTLGTPSQTSSHASGLYPAENAVDGDVATFNHTDSGGTGSAWELHFPTEFELGSIEVVMRDCCSGRLNGGTLRLFDTEADMVFEHFVIDPGAGAMFTVEFPGNTFARDIRIGFDAGQTGIVHLAEVRVYAPPGTPPVVHSFTVTPDSISSGQSATLAWNITDALDVEIRGVGPVAASGSTTISPPTNFSYILAATNGWGTTTLSRSVQVDGIPLVPIITEFSAFPDDWVEIWNPGNSPLDLTGWYLSDETDDPLDWPIPPGLIIPAGGFVVIDEPFGIAREEGSYLALVNPAGSVVSSYTYPRQSERGSYGANLDGVATYFLAPSPGAFNDGATTLGFLEGVSFSAGRGFYDAALSLTLAARTDGATVLYSTDGSDPSTPYTAPLQITTTTVVRAIETLPGHEPSRSEAHTYLFVGHVPSQAEYPAGFPADWLPASASGALAPISRRSDYEMDPAVVHSGPFFDDEGASFDIADALLDLPSICLTLPTGELLDPTDGLHANAQKRGIDWERDISMEILDPVAGNHFHTGCGFRIHGGRGRVYEMLKKSFRLYFRGAYGATKLDYPIFDGMPSGGLDHLVLRGGNGKTYASPWRSQDSLKRVTYLRDQFLRDCVRDMGQPSFAGNFVHLYINGLYWGLYNPVERPGGPYAANHFGGDNDLDWDFLKWANGLPRQIVAGDVFAWDEVMNLARADPVGNYDPIAQRVDIDNLADYMIANAYVANRDWSATGNNGYAFRSRNGDWDDKFRFMCWDGEESLLSTTDHYGGSGRNDDTPMDLHKKLRTGVEYQLRSADRIHRHIVDEDGVLRTTPSTERHEFLVARIDRAISAESARWGDLLWPVAQGDPYPGPAYTFTREADWLDEIINLNDNYFTTRHTTTLGHLQNEGLYPATNAPVASLVNGDQLSLTAPAGTIWFTTDGSDPRLPGGAVSPDAQVYESLVETTLVASGSVWSYLDDGSNLAGTDWATGSFDNSAWAAGPAPLGYGDVSGTTINTSVGYGPDPDNKHITTYFRHEFTVTDAASLGSIQLRFFRDDGIAIYINGTEIVRSNLPAGALDAGTLAPFSIGGSDESALQSFAFPSGILQEGENVLAVELHQRSGDSSDLGFDVSLVAPLGGLPLNGDAHIKTRALNGGEWSALEEETYRFADPARELVLSEVMYHPADPSAAELAAGFDDDDYFEFIELRNISDRNIVLNGLRFTKGVDVALAGTLAPGATALVVNNLAAFLMRYGADLPVIAQWEGGDKLDNGGELIRLRDGANNIVLEFEYDDVSPWPMDPDGSGSSLVLVDPLDLPDHGNPLNWRTSIATGGTPGGNDATSFPGGNHEALLAYATGGGIPAIQRHADGRVSFSILLNQRAEDVVGWVEVSDDLRTWQPADPGLVRTAVQPVSDGFARVTFTTSLPVVKTTAHFRYAVALR